MEKIGNIGFDADDVLINQMEAFNAFHNNKYNKKRTLDEQVTFDLCSLWEITKEQFLADEREFYESDFYRQVEIAEGGYEVVDSLCEDYNLMVVTGRGKDVEHYLLATLAELYRPHHFVSIHHVGSAHNNNLIAHKWERCKEHDTPVLIDDFHGHLLQAAQNGVYGILLSKPWNQNITDLPKSIYRVPNLYEALNLIVKKENIFFKQN
jgi:uncharacterized HAD superfamily protein